MNNIIEKMIQCLVGVEEKEMYTFLYVFIFKEIYPSMMINVEEELSIDYMLPMFVEFTCHEKVAPFI